jgi:biopolymer transport protein ExbD
MAGNKRRVQEINASSMADIAFLLLIFFLVATTMNVDSGISRTLPPWVENPDVPDVKERNIMEVKVDMASRIMAQGKVIQLWELKDMAKDFLQNRNNDEDLPEKENKQIDLIGTFPVSKGIISLQNDRGTSYEAYMQVQNELARALNEVRDEVSVEYFGEPFLKLDKTRQDAVLDAVPTAISEAEPKNIGGN